MYVSVEQLSPPKKESSQPPAPSCPAGLLYAAEKYPQQVFLTTDKFMALHDTIEWSLLSSLARCMYTFCIPEGGGLVGSEMMTFLVI